MLDIRQEFAEFNGPSPDIRDVAERMSQISGLAMDVTESGLKFAAAFAGDRLKLTGFGLPVHPGTDAQRVILKSRQSDEPTLMMLALVAIESLGGKTQKAITPEIRRKYGRPISETELRRRLRAHRLWGFIQMCVGILVFIPLLPIMFISMFWSRWINHGTRPPGRRPV